MLIYMTLDIRIRFNFAGGNGLNGRAYIFPPYSKRVDEAMLHLEKTISNPIFGIQVNRVFKPDFTNAIMWSDDKDSQMIDFFGYSLEKGDWKSNPSFYSWVTKDGMLVPSEGVQEVTCEKGMILMGVEGAYRLSTSGLSEYLQQAPELPGFKITGRDLTKTI